jgi:hypothetical protein
LPPLINTKSRWFSPEYAISNIKGEGVAGVTGVQELQNEAVHLREVGADLSASIRRDFDSVSGRLKPVFFDAIAATPESPFPNFFLRA